MNENSVSGAHDNSPLDFFMRTGLLYYLSCCFLLLGTYIMMRSTILSTSFIIKYYQTYSLYWLYEIILVVLSIILIKKLKLTKDGLVLSALGILLLIDPTFFNNVFYSYNLKIGISVNTICLLFALVLFLSLIYIGNIPHHLGTMIFAIGTIIFVYLYPILLNLHLAAEALTNNLFYILWWLPALLLMLTWGYDHALPAKDAYVEENERDAAKFISWQMIVGVFVLFSHLVESNVGYGLTFYAIYLSPFILAVTLLAYSLFPDFHFTVNGKQLIWVAVLLSTMFASFQDDIFKHSLSFGLTLTPLRFTLIAQAVIFLLFWKRYRQLRYMVAFLLCPFFMLIGLKFWPFVYLTLIFTVLAVMRKHWVYALIAGLAFWGLMMFVLPSSLGKINPLIFIQGSGLWAAFVIWFYDLKEKNNLLNAIAVLLLITAMLFGYKYYFLGLSLFLLLAGILLKQSTIKIISVCSTIVGLVWVLNKLILLLKQRMGFIFGTGVITIVISFILLFLGFYFSVLKTKKSSLVGKDENDSDQDRHTDHQ